MSEQQIVAVPFEEHIRNQFVEYAKDVTQSRAVPDIRDGLKPVQRRVLMTMHDLHLSPNTPYKKSARTVGQCLGFYHPHGDSSVYGAMVTVAQDFSTKYPLVDMHGNVGSVDGDSAAAMRYTEARLSPIGNLLLEDIDKNTVDFIPNYDDSETEPSVLSGLWPELLANGNIGIAVGMASSFAPHLAKDIYKACDKILENGISDKETSIDEIIDIIKAPDFPTGGIIINPAEVRQAYIEGKGRVVIRSKYSIEKAGHGRQSIVITEIPYKINKKNLVAEIADLAKETIPDIYEVRDESSREGTRIVVELRKNANVDMIMAMLFKDTKLQAQFNLNHVALVNGHPRLNLSLKDLLDAFIQHSVVVCRRKIQYELEKAREREHIVSAIVTILQDIDNAIPLIRGSKTRKETIELLRTNYSLDEIQASAIADMKLWTLNEEGVGKYRSELDALVEKINRYNEILGDIVKLLTFTREELAKKAELFKKEKRKTEISYDINPAYNVNKKAYVKDEDVIMMLTHQGIVKIVRLNDYRTQSRNGCGISTRTKDEDFVEKIFSMRTHDDILVVTNTGRAVVYPVYEIPIVDKENQGKYLSNYIKLENGERIIEVIPIDVEKNENEMLFLVTKMGRGKCLKLDQLSKRTAGVSVIKMTDENDEVVACSLVKEDDKVFSIATNGKALKTSVGTIRPQGRSGTGVKFMTFKGDDNIVTAFKVNDNNEIAIFLQNGLGKRMQVSAISEKKNRGGQGVFAVRVDKKGTKAGRVIAAFVTNEYENILAISKAGKIIKTPAKNIPLMITPGATGVKTIKLDKSDELIAATSAQEEEE